MIETSDMVETQIFGVDTAFLSVRCFCRQMGQDTLGERWKVVRIEHVGGQGFGLSGIDAYSGESVWIKIPRLGYHEPERMRLETIDAANRRIDGEARYLSLDACRSFWPALRDVGEFENPCLAVSLRMRQRFLVMEYVEGTSANRHMWNLAHAGESEQNAVDFAADWRRFVDVFESRLLRADPDVIYVDIAPSNFLVTEDRTIRILDAGSIVPRTKPFMDWPIAPRYLPDQWRNRGRGRLADREIESYLTAAKDLVQASLVDEYRRAVAFLMRRSGHAQTS